MENEELIRQNMERTRESLSDKLEVLENKLLGTVEEATSAVRETVTTVKESVHEGVESVKEAVDIPGHVERRPWLMFGGAVVGGFFLGKLVMPHKTSTSTDYRSRSMPFRPSSAYDDEERQQPKRESAAKSKSSIFAMLEPELSKVKKLAVGFALGTIRDNLTRLVPPNIADNVRSIIDGVTHKLGGEPVAKNDDR